MDFVSCQLRKIMMRTLNGRADAGKIYHIPSRHLALN
jgi:hypothetical protein